MQRLASAFGATITLESESLSQLGCQGVILALPPDQNSLYGKLFLKQGLDVFIQKPLATTYQEARELLDLARLKERILMGGSDFRFRADVLKAKTLIKRGYIGEPRYLHGQFCHVFKSSGWRQNVFQDMGEHVVSVVKELMGPAKEIALKRHSPFSGQMYFEGASWFADARSSWESPRGPMPEIVVEGTEGTLHLNTSRPSEIDCYKVRTWEPGKFGRIPGLRDWLTNAHEKIYCKGPHSYTRKLQEFLEAIVSRPSTTTFVEDLETFRVLFDLLSLSADIGSGRDHEANLQGGLRPPLH
jgi:predicted dehydrogenase